MPRTLKRKSIKRKSIKRRRRTRIRGGASQELQELQKLKTRFQQLKTEYEPLKKTQPKLYEKHELLVFISDEIQNLYDVLSDKTNINKLIDALGKLAKSTFMDFLLKTRDCYDELDAQIAKGGNSAGDKAREVAQQRSTMVNYQQQLAKNYGAI